MVPVRRTTLAALALVAPVWLVAMLPEARGQTHLGQTVNAHVTLSLEFIVASPCSGFGSRAFRRVRRDGSIASTPFVVPAGKALVVTDVHWTAVNNDFAPLPAGRGTRLALAMHLGTEFLQIVYVSPPVYITAENQNAQVGGADHLVAGFIVGAGKSLCAFVNSVNFGGSAAEDPRDVLLYGYLIDD
jgi:hypothetical protein